MNHTVGFTAASIAAPKIHSDKITQAGVFSPVRHIPPQEFLNEAKARGMHIDHKTLEMD